MRRFYQIFWLPFYRWWGLRHIRRARVWHYGGLRIDVPAGIFHPGIYFSTPIFLEFLQAIDFQGKSVVDIGTGSGILALFAARKGASATAIDINPAAVETASQNARRNGLFAAVTVLESDLFDAIPLTRFDYVLVNPPYYPRQPENATEHAFFAGAGLEYFDKLFRQLPGFTDSNSRLYMILSEDCDYEKINAAALRHGFGLQIVFERKKWGERLFVVST